MNYLEKEINKQQEIINSLKKLIENTKRENDILELSNMKKRLDIYKILNDNE